jgi:hypothetical protein
MTKEEALDLALEVLEYPGPSWIEARQPAITAIKQALAAPVYVKTFHGGKPWPLHPAPVQERNFCERCGKRLGDSIHTCTPPENLEAKTT